MGTDCVYLNISIVVSVSASGPKLIREIQNGEVHCCSTHFYTCDLFYFSPLQCYVTFCSIWLDLLKSVASGGPHFE